MPEHGAAVISDYVETEIFQIKLGTKPELLR